MVPESIVSVCNFPLAEEHRADNLADALEEHGIEPTLLYDSTPEGETVLVAVPQPQLEAALRLAESFLANYDAELDALISRQLKPSLGERLWALTYTVLIPLLLAWYSIESLWKVLFWDPGSEPYLSTWRDRDLGIGIIGLTVFAGYVVTLAYFRRRHSW